MIYLETEEGTKGVSVVDATERLAEGLASRAVLRDEIVGTDDAAFIFVLYDHMVLQDTRLIGHLIEAE